MRNITIVFLLFILSSTAFSFAQSTSTLFDEAMLIKHVEILSSDEFEGRRTGEKGNEKGRKYIVAQFQALKAKPFGAGYEQEFAFKRKEIEYKGKNVLAKIEGTEFPEKYIVISAHHDHLGVSAEGKIYNGADDDASGVSALFAFAEYLAKNPPKHAVILAAFDAEEMGLQGARHFVEALKEKTIVLNINMDMISRSAKDEIYMVGARYNDNLKAIVSTFENPTTTKLSQGHDGTDEKDDWTYASDHGPFHNAKIPFLYFGNEDHDGYHKPEDDFKDITPQFFKNTVKIIISVFKTIDEKGL